MVTPGTTIVLLCVIVLLLFACVLIFAELVKQRTKAETFLERSELLEERICTMQKLVYDKFNYHVPTTPARLEVAQLLMETGLDDKNNKSCRSNN